MDISMRMNFFIIRLLSILLSLVCFQDLVIAGENPSVSENFVFFGKKVISLEPVEELKIEMPDNSIYYFGENFYASLITRLMETGRYLLVDSSKNYILNNQGVSLNQQWAGSVTPVATIHIKVDALNFQTGSRGERMFYGFDERMGNYFSDGTPIVNEFHFKLSADDLSEFGDTFKSKKSIPFDSRSGLNLGDGFNINVGLAGTQAQYARYHSHLHFQLTLESWDHVLLDHRQIQVHGSGYFLDLAAHYHGYSAGVTLGRKDVMSQALKKAWSRSIDAIDRSLVNLPMVAQVDAVLQGGTVLMGTGPFSDVQPGVIYELDNFPGTQIEVDSSGSSGSAGHVRQGDPSQVTVGALLRQVLPYPPVAENDASPSAVESIVLAAEVLPDANILPRSSFSSTIKPLFKPLLESLFLPYRIGRYFSYDQTYHHEADRHEEDLQSGRKVSKKSMGKIVSLFKKFNFSNEPWALQIGLTNQSLQPALQSTLQSNEKPWVAVIDSGVDYNHPFLHKSLWLNPNPVTDLDSRKDRYGWDFISGDSRPYDDHYHGTQIASLIVAVAPTAQIIPLKVFNPWGVTQSAALYSAFKYAVDHQAKIIVCGWSTSIQSIAIQKGIEYAQQNGVLVVTAAGDQGVDLEKTKIYPASNAPSYDNLLVVTGVDEQDQLFEDSGRRANYGPAIVMIAAPAQGIRVAEPRFREARESSTGLAAAIVAGVLARNLAQYPNSGTYQDWVRDLLSHADSVLGLSSKVRGGLRVRAK